LFRRFAGAAAGHENAMAPDESPRRVLVTGATGYIGGRLVPRLLDRGYDVRCLVRSAQKLAGRSWAADPRVDIVTGELQDAARTAAAMEGCRAAYYLVHSMMSAGPAYAARDREMAGSFAAAAARASLERIIYLGGLGELGEGLSEHLASRREVERVLASGPVPVTVLRAAMIIGSGSASFEILRYLVERLPVMVTPRWVGTECQPIAVDNVLGYLVACLDAPSATAETLDIGGPDVLTYLALMRIMAEELGVRKRVVVPVPVLTPRLSALWIHLVTPLSRSIAAPLAEGLRNRVVCRDDRAARLMPQPLITVRDGVRAALRHRSEEEIPTTWTMAGPIAGDPDWAGGTVFTDERTAEVAAPPRAVFRALTRLGGANGWYAFDWLWRLRGVADRIVGGPGLSRGRRDPERLWYGEAVDFWRVTGIETDRRLRLRAEMKLPGDAVLEFAVEPMSRGTAGASGATRCRLVQTARFRPRGLFGLAYWYAAWPFHALVFGGLLRGICRAAERLDRAAPVAESPS
jgi:uncharacterized protein YbjT (DUF2867 family)